MRIPFLNHNSVIANVSLAKQKVHPVTLELRQEYGDHHHFDMTLDYDMYGDDFLSNPVKHIELIGRLVFIRFKHQESSTEGYQFKGVVTSVRQTGREGKKGYLVVSGSSPTIMLEKGNRLDIYSNQSLYQITKQITDRAYSDYISFGSEPVYKNKIEFLMQYNESDWDFLKRIAYLYRENLYYSGHELLFGSFDDLETVALIYDREIIDLEFCSKLLATNFERYQYVSQNDTTIERELPKQIDNSNDFVDSAEEMSYNAMNVQEHSKTYMDAPVYTNSEVSDLLKREKSRNAAQTITIKGKSKTYKTTLGRVIHISIPQELSATSTIGNYRVIKSIHRIDENNRYSCEFEAVPASLDSIPANQPKAQYADSVVARVKSNEDPLNQGRVQVDFQFASNYNYSWLRVLTPNAGSSEQVSQNRGMVFVPEKGDQVMIGFEYGDPNRPYVMGSLFHGKNGKGGGQNNAEKSIITKSGVQIVFNDDSRSLHIQDPSGNTWDMDGQGNIKVFAPKDIEFISGKNMRMQVGANFDLIVGNESRMETSRKMFVNTPFMHQQVSNKFYMQTGDGIIKSTDSFKIESANRALISAMKSLLLHTDGDMTSNSMGNYFIQSGGSTTHNNSPDPYDPTKEIIDSRTVVHFRPKDTWTGEDFGFDWMRVGDTNFLVETKGFTYERICSPANYRELEKEYTPHTISWKVKKGPLGQTLRGTLGYPIDEDYFVPWLMLYPSKVDTKKYKNSKATLELTIEIEENHEPETIELKYNKDYFKIQELNFPKTKGKHKLEIDIECKKEFDVDQQIDVVAIETDADKNKFQKLAGRLKVAKNKDRYNLEIVLVKVKSKNIGVKGKEKGTVGKIKEGMKKYLNQILIEPVFKEVDLDMSKTDAASGGQPVFNKTFKDSAINEKSIAVTDAEATKSTTKLSNDISNLHQTMNDNFNEQHKDKAGNPLYPNTLKVYLINEDCALKNDQGKKLTTVGGHTIDIHSDSVLIFKENNTGEIVTHEVLHALGARHPDDGNANIKYNKCETDNLMDYSSQIGIPTFQIWKWQADIVHTDSKLTKD